MFRRTDELIDEIMERSEFEVYYVYDPKIITVVVMHMPNGEKVIVEHVCRDVTKFDKESAVDICKDDIRKHLRKVKVRDTVLDKNYIHELFFI